MDEDFICTPSHVPWSEKMIKLSDYILEINDQRFGASDPETGDVTGDSLERRTGSSLSPRVTIGVTALGAERLRELVGQDARLLTNATLDPRGIGRDLGTLTIIKIDDGSALVVGEPHNTRGAALHA
jgi:hypothetical protein